MSGRSGGYVYWWHNGRLHWHRYVVPNDPRTPMQRRSRAAFAVASKAWSENQPLTKEQRDHWSTAAARIKSTPRLGASGFRTAQVHFVGVNSHKERWGLPLLLEPPKGGRKNVECGMQKPEAAPEVSLPQRLKPTSSDRLRVNTGPLPDLHREPKGCTGRRNALRVPIQVMRYQALTRPSSECPRSATRLLPVCRRWHVQSGRRAARISLPGCSFALVQTRRLGHFSGLWRGG
jgi:hypothetical protein